MGLESFTYISSFNASNPVSAADMVAQGANHLRGIKSAILLTFPNISGAVTVTHAQLNTVPNLAPKADPTFTGTVSVPTASSGTNDTTAASTAYVNTAIAAAGSGLSLRLYDKGRLEYYGS